MFQPVIEFYDCILVREIGAEWLALKLLRTDEAVFGEKERLAH